MGHRFHDDLENEVFLGVCQLAKSRNSITMGSSSTTDVVPRAQRAEKFVGEIAVGANTLFFPAFRADQAAPWPELPGR